MPIQKLPGTAITAGSIPSSAVDSSLLSPKITAIAVANSSYTVLDDTAIDVAGGYIVLTGVNFVSGCTVIIGSATATSVSFINSTTVRAQVPAQTAGSYTVYLINPDGGVAIRVNGLNYSGTPAWSTTSPLSSGTDGVAISIQLSATSNSTVSYSLQAGSTLPAGLTLSNAGLLSGTVSGLSVDTTYNFTVVATDLELQDTPRAFSVTIIVGDPYFPYVTLLLPGNGTNGAQNNTFLDSSTNNFTIVRNGNTTQGTFAPYGSNWSNFFDGSGDFLTLSDNAAFDFGTGAFAIECFFYLTADAAANNDGVRDASLVQAFPTSGSNFNYAYGIGLTGNASTTGTGIYFSLRENSNTEVGKIITTTVSKNAWHHLVVCRSGTNLGIFFNGTRISFDASYSRTVDDGGWPLNVGSLNYPGYINAFPGYISNARMVKGSSVYDPTQSTITVPTSPFTAISGTSLLTCQSNRFIDNSTNAFTISRSGDVSIQRFSPFSPTAPYAAGTDGGSGYFDGSGDYLTLNYTASAFDWWVGNYTLEAWIYPRSLSGWYYTDGAVNKGTIIGNNAFNSTGNNWSFGLNSSGNLWFAYYTGANQGGGTSNTVTLNAWNHVALVVNGTNITLYLNGVGTSLGNISGTPGSGGVPLTIGAGNNAYVNGYISNLRIVKGTAVYTTNFTPPTAPLTAVTNTSLLLNFTNAGIIDSAEMNDLETVGNAQTSTAQSKFGGGSMLFDGTGDWLSIPNNPAYDFGSGNFTWEAWVYPTATGAYLGVYAKRATNLVYGPFQVLYDSGSMSVYASTTGSAWQVALIASSTTPINTWTHVAVVRNGSTITLYLNGVSAGSSAGAGTSALITNTAAVSVGADSASGTAGFAGYIDDLRITRGYARYTANFTPPTSAFPGK